LPPFSPEPSLFLFAVEKLKNENILDYNFACVCMDLKFGL
jgi:hypothetical protein